MEQETKAEQVTKRAEEISKGKSGVEIPAVVQQAIEQETPLDEARRLNRETKEMRVDMEKIRSELRELASFTALSGRAFAPMPKAPTEEEVTQERVKQMSSKFVELLSTK